MLKRIMTIGLLAMACFALTACGPIGYNPLGRQGQIPQYTASQAQQGYPVMASPQQAPQLFPISGETFVMFNGQGGWSPINLTDGNQMAVYGQAQARTQLSVAYTDATANNAIAIQSNMRTFGYDYIQALPISAKGITVNGKKYTKIGMMQFQRNETPAHAMAPQGAGIPQQGGVPNNQQTGQTANVVLPNGQVVPVSPGSTIVLNVDNTPKRDAVDWLNLGMTAGGLFLNGRSQFWGNSH